MVLRVLLVADTHGALDARVEALAGECQYVVHAGDIGSAAVLDRLARGGKLVAVRGNNDVAHKWPVHEQTAIDRLPEQERVALPGGALIVIHGHQCARARSRHTVLRRRFPDARVIVYGHTHRAVCDNTVDPWVLNPGAAGRTRTFGGASCMILEVEAGDWRVRAHRFDRRDAS